MALLDDISVSEIKQMMEHEHLTQAEVARRLDVSQQRISALIGARRTPNAYDDFEEKAKDLSPKRLAEYYGTTVNAIYKKLCKMRRANGQPAVKRPKWDDFKEKAKELNVKQLAEYYGVTTERIYQKMQQLRLKENAQHITVTPQPEDIKPEPDTATPTPEVVPEPAQCDNDKPIIEIQETRYYKGRSGICYIVNATTIYVTTEHPKKDFKVDGYMRPDDLAGIIKELNQVYSMEVKKGERV